MSYALLALIVAQMQTGFSPGLIDTLEAIAGRPKGIEVAALPQNWLGGYVNPNDVILISPRVALFLPRHKPDSVATMRSRMSPDWVLSHEFGHRFDKRRGYMPSRVWMREHFLVIAGCDYANFDAGERWAEAFANAIDFLRFSAGEPSHPVVLRSLAQREVFVPGTAAVAAYLLRFRVFRDHPLNRRLLP